MAGNCAVDLIKSTGFGARNTGKAGNGDVVRAGVAAGQLTNAVRAGKSSSNTLISATSSKIANVCENLTKNNQAFAKISKVVDFASKNVNPLIVVSSGVKVATAKDKVSEAINQTGTLTGMFLCEGWMKKNLGKYIAKLPINQKYKAVLEGLAFIAGSIGASTLGYEAAKKISGGIKNVENKIKDQDHPFTSKKLEYKA